MPPTPFQCSCRTQSPSGRVTRLVPAGLPSGVVTSQSPSQKSNWWYSGAEQDGAAAAGVVAGEAAPASATVAESARDSTAMARVIAILRGNTRSFDHESTLLPGRDHGVG